MNYNNANYGGLNNDLTATNWEEEVFNDENINEINSLKVWQPHALQKQIPTKLITIRHRDKAFMNSSIKKLMTKRNRIHRKAVIILIIWENYRDLRNKVIGEIRASRDRYNEKNCLTR